MWLTVEEVMELGISRRSIFQKIASGEWRTLEFGKSRNGKAIRKIALDSLPEQLQFEWARINRLADEPEDDESLTIEETTADVEIRLTQALMRFDKQVTREKFLSEANRLLEVINRYDVINPKRIKTASGKHEFVEAVQKLCDEMICTDSIILAIEPHRAKKMSPFTLDGLARQAKEIGLLAFLRAAPTAQKTRDKRNATVSPAAVEWVNQNWRRYASPRKMFDELERRAKREKWKIPSESWLYRRWQSIPNAVKTLVQQGEKAYNSKFAPYVPRDYSDLEALQVLCGDHSVRDVSVVLPDGSLARPWLTLWLDLRTYLIWGWSLNLTPSSNTIGLAYANGVRTFGAQPLARPDSDFYSYLYTDQGKDYRSQTLQGKTLEFKKAAKIEGGLQVLTTQRRVGFYDETGIKQLLARGYNAKEKPVERVHKDISDWEQNTFFAEFCGRDAKNKPETWVSNWHRHEKLRKKFANNVPAIIQESPFMTVDDYRDNLAGWIQEHNTGVHTRTTLGGASIVPLDEFNRLYTTRYEISDDALALLLMKVQKRTIGKNGVSLFQPHWNFLHQAMSEFKGEEIEIRYSDDDYSRVWAILPNGNIVEAENVTPSGLLNPNRKTLETISKFKAQERKTIRDFDFITQSKIRGESAEERFTESQQEAKPDAIALRKTGTDDSRADESDHNNGGTIHQFTRFNMPKTPAKPPSTSPDDITNTPANDNIFQFPSAPKPPVINEWGFDEDE